MKNYNSFEIELAILIIETESMDKEEKEEDFSSLKFYDKKEKIEYYNILKTEKDKLKELDISYKRDIEELEKNYIVE
jgi:hypothetical protein